MHNSALLDAPRPLTSFAQPGAMAFSADSDIGLSWRHALRFAGEGGRLATLPDILEARLASGAVTSLPWTSWFTTASSEYYGVSPWGVPVIVVAHGNGPLADPDFAIGAYAAASEGRKGVQIPQDVFNSLLEGDFGDVDVVDVASLCTRFEYPFSQRSAEELLQHPLFVARLGGIKLAQRYLNRHCMAAIGKREEWSPGHGTRFPGTLIRMGEPERPYVLLGDSKKDIKMEPYLPETGFASAHFLAIGRTGRTSHFRERLDSFECDLGIHNFGDGVRFIGIRQGSALDSLHPGFSHAYEIDLDAENIPWQSSEDTAQPALYTLMEVGGRLFTMHVKDGDGLDSGEGRHEVVSAAPIGSPMLFSTSAGGYYGFFKYGVSEVLEIAPAGANAYKFISEPGTNGTTSWRDVQFFHVEVDRSRHLPTMGQIKADFDLQMRILGIA